MKLRRGASVPLHNLMRTIMIEVRKLDDQDVVKMIDLCEKENIPRAEAGDGLGCVPNRYVWVQNTLNLLGQQRDGDQRALVLGAYDGDHLVAFLTAHTFTNWYSGELTADMKDVCTDMSHPEYHKAFELIFGEFIRNYKELEVTAWRADTIRSHGDEGQKFGSYIEKVFGNDNDIVLNVSVRGVVKK